VAAADPSKRTRASVSPGAARAVAPGEVVLGLQGTVDYEVEWDGEVIDALTASYGISADELDPDEPVVDERSLLVALLGFLATGRGGERHAVSSEVVERFASRLRKTITLGGTCVRAALVMRQLGVPSLLHLVSTDENVRRLLPDDCAHITSATGDTLDPHLIVQFRPGDAARLGERTLVAVEANRVIIANDPPAERLLLSEELGERVARARVFLVSGFNTIGDRDVLEERLAEIRDVVARMPAGGVAVYEDAGFHEQGFAPRVADAIGPVVDVFSLNEDELQARLGRPVDLLDPVSVATAVAELRARVPHPILVVHTRHWTLVHGERAAGYAAAADNGNATAAARYAYGDGLTAERVAAIATGSRQESSVVFAREVEDLIGDAATCLPGFDVRVPSPTTIGLGDTFIGGFIAAIATGRTP
jgi:ADP-dependent phosphofructokinase/glucokinase